MFKMKCIAQNYSWGNEAKSSLVAKILRRNNEEVDESKRYAEYWIGSHVNGPSSVYSTDGTIKPIIKCLEDGKETLDFLFKILSIDIPLSIQLHPNLEMSHNLHKQFPSMYKDSNHKPEMFIAISDNFELFFGLKPIQSALQILSKYLDVFNFKEANAFHDNPSLSTYQSFINSIINLSKEANSCIIQSILSREGNDALIEKLRKNFGEDIGIIVSLFMNRITCKKNDAFFILPNIPHAYIKGDCFEIMANSDNVIRLGLTNKEVDKGTFQLILNDHFNEMIVEPEKAAQTLSIKKNEHKTVYYNPSFGEFQLEKIEFEKNGLKEIELELKKETAIFISGGELTGQVEMKEEMNLKEYECYFIPHDVKIRLSMMGDNAEILIASANKK